MGCYNSLSGGPVPMWAERVRKAHSIRLDSNGTVNQPNRLITTCFNHSPNQAFIFYSVKYRLTVFIIFETSGRSSKYLAFIDRKSNNVCRDGERRHRPERHQLGRVLGRYTKSLLAARKKSQVTYTDASNNKSVTQRSFNEFIHLGKLLNKEVSSNKLELPVRGAKAIFQKLNKKFYVHR